MEDVDLMRRIKRNGKRIAIFREPVMTSTRRWKQIARHSVRYEIGF